MYLENIKAKILSGKNYRVKDEKGNKTDELSIMNLVLMLDVKKDNTLDNAIFKARLAKPKFGSSEQYELDGYTGNVIDLNGIQSGDNVIINADIPMRNDFMEDIIVYKMELD